MPDEVHQLSKENRELMESLHNMVQLFEQYTKVAKI